MAAGKAIIVPRQPNLLEIVTEEHDALCFRQEDVRDLARVLDRLIADLRLRRELSSSARRTIELR
jgi:glycosyltransferase involved in cell wall biosynthesis